MQASTGLRCSCSLTHPWGVSCPSRSQGWQIRITGRDLLLSAGSGNFLFLCWLDYVLRLANTNLPYPFCLPVPWSGRIHVKVNRYVDVENDCAANILEVGVSRLLGWGQKDPVHRRICRLVRLTRWVAKSTSHGFTHSDVVWRVGQ